jgi:hypothetical protein
MKVIQIHSLIRTKRKSISLVIDDKARLIVRAPVKTNFHEIEKFILDKSKWIEQKQRLVRERLRQQPKKRFEAGEEFLFLGKLYKLKISNNGKYIFEFNKQNFILSKNHQSNARNLFIRWYKLQAYRIFKTKAEHYASKARLSYNQIKLSDADKRWGSCTSGRNLNFNWRLVMAPSKIIDYVIIHELAHLKELNHSKKFWALVERLCPNYLKYKQWLDDNGHLLNV